MPATNPNLLTVDDYRLLPETGPRYQLIEGEFFLWPSPDRYHQDISGNLLFIVCTYLEASRTGVAYHAPLHVFLDEHNVYHPDLTYVSNERRGVLVDEGVEGAPDLVVEILSRSTADLDRNQKRKVYTRQGVKELWIVNPENKTVSVYFLQQDAERPAGVYGEADTFSSPCFPNLTITGAEIFRRP